MTFECNACCDSENAGYLPCTYTNPLIGTVENMPELVCPMSNEECEWEPALVDRNKIEDLCQAHMAGQMDAGCKEPSWSNAHSYYTHKIKSAIPGTAGNSPASTPAQQPHGGQSVSQPAPNCEDATSPCY